MILINTNSEARSRLIEDNVGLKMLDKHSSARSSTFVSPEMLMKNRRTLKLLSQYLERDVLVENLARGLGGSGARELGSSLCLHVNHFQNKLRAS